MSIKEKVSDFISELQGDGENLFPYLPNKDWKPGKNIYYSGPYWDCLLYTSPSPRDRYGSRMPSSA